ncbi:ABC transporter permease [Actinoplanes sp. NPDC023936]|uniref:ABC transporter permease n=1 Tax=Actinoplanes sp. NPDC023936 TaxID=3154910 RepID=UPI0033D193D5
MSWLRSYALLVRWNALRLRFLLPLFALVSTGLSVGIIVGFAYLMPTVDTTSAAFLATGGPTLGLITVGLVMAPNMVAQSKLQGSFEFDQTLPVPPMASVAAGLTIWIVGALPSLVLSVLVAAFRFDLDLQVHGLLVPAALLVALTATALGYGMAHALPAAAVGLVAQLIVFVTLMFSPVNFPADRLPGWLQAIHVVLPFQYMAQVIRETLTPAAGGISVTPYAVLAAWCVVGLAATYRLMTRRG